MSNEFKDWLQDKFSDVLLENRAIDKMIQTVIIDNVNWYGLVEGIKDGCPVRYNVWFNDDDWYYKQI